MIDFRRRRMLLVGLGLGLGLAGTVSVRADRPRPNSFSVELYPPDPNGILVEIDTRNVPTNFYFQSVEVVLGLYDERKRRIREQYIPVGEPTPAGWTFIRGGYTLRYVVSFRPDPRAAYIHGDRLRWGKDGPVGGMPDAASPWEEIPSNSPLIPIAPPR